jgi:dUTP pyrophosphatase
VPKTFAIAVRQQNKQVPLPAYAHADDAGADLHSAEGVVLLPGERHIVSTGIAVAIPLGFAGFIHPRSGLAAKHGITIVNAPGTIDSSYRGEIKVILLNTGKYPYQINPGDKIAQLVIQPVITALFESVNELDITARNDGGFGSTGR